jgi:lysophospholipase L1-like esterase
MSVSGSPLASTSRWSAALVVSVLVLLVTACGGRSVTAAEPSGSPTAGPVPPTAAPSPTTGSTDPSTTALPGSGPSGVESSTDSTAGIRFAVVGDSLTAGDVPISGNSTPGRGSWVPFAKQDERLDFVGGWAVPGATTAAMVAGVRPVDADVLVVMGGTNDVGTGVPWAVTQTNLEEIVRTVAFPTVLLSAIPPRDNSAERTVQTNRDLEQLAASQGWGFVDPWADMSSDGTWIPGTSEDGIHPVEEVATLVGQRLAAAVAAAG